MSNAPQRGGKQESSLCDGSHVEDSDGIPNRCSEVSSLTIRCVTRGLLETSPAATCPKVSLLSLSHSLDSDLSLPPRQTWVSPGCGAVWFHPSIGTWRPMLGWKFYLGYDIFDDVGFYLSEPSYSICLCLNSQGLLLKDTNMPPQNTPCGHKDYFELRAIEKKQIQEKLPLFPLFT